MCAKSFPKIWGGKWCGVGCDLLGSPETGVNVVGPAAQICLIQKRFKPNEVFGTDARTAAKKYDNDAKLGFLVHLPQAAARTALV